MNHIPVIFSTVTGNAVKLAFAAVQVAGNSIGPYNICYILGDEKHFVNNVTNAVLKEHDTFILVYWCDLGDADKDTIELISRLSGKNLILLGTLGASADGEHAKKVADRVVANASRQNKVLTHYLCRGSIDLYRSNKKKALPEGEKGHLNEKGYKRHLQSQGHPDKDDLESAILAVKSALAELGEK